MKLKIKKSIADGFSSIKANPVLILIGLFYTIIIKLLEPSYLSPLNGRITYNLSEMFFSYGGLNLIAIILVSIFINGVMIVLVAKGKKFSLASALKLVASKYVTLVLASILGFIINVLGLIALILPGIFLSIKLFYFEQAVLLNNKGIVESLKTSWNVTRGNWWRVFALVILIAIISLIIIMPVSFLSKIVADFIGGIFIVPLTVVAYTKSYLQLKR